MVVGPAMGIAVATPLTDVAVLSRVGIVDDLTVPGQRRLQPAPDLPVMGGVVTRSIGLRFKSRPGSNHVHKLGLPHLDCADEVRVERELQDGSALRLTRQLGVNDLVRPVAKVIGNVDASQNVRPSGQLPPARAAWTMILAPDRIASAVTSTAAWLTSTPLMRVTSLPDSLRCCT